MTNDPFLELRLDASPTEPDPDFRAVLRDRVARALESTQGEPMSIMSEPTIPSRPNTMTPYLCCSDARAAIAWYAEAFDAVLQGEIFPMDESGDDRVGHAEMVVGDSRFMISDEWPEGGVFSPTTRGGATTAFVLNVADVDAVYDRAVALGAAVERPVVDEHYGSRAGWLSDPFGHRWSISTPTGAGDPYVGEPIAIPSPTFAAEDLFEEIGYYVMSRPDLDQAKAFYGGVFAWDFADENQTPNGARGAHVTSSKVPFGLTDDAAVQPWHPWFRVRDLDATLARIRAHGGEVLEVTHYASGGGAVCRDDQGVQFDLYEPAPGY